MLILQIDSSSELCSVAVSRQGEMLGMEINSESFQHGRDINFLIKALLDNLSFDLSDIQAISVNRGPGSYTALRIGMATAKGLCYGLGIPLIAPTGLEILIHYAVKKFPETDDYIALIDARRMEVYSAGPVENLRHPLEYKAEILTENSFSALLHKKVCFIGNGVEKWKAIWPGDNHWIGEHLEVNAGMMSGISYCFLERTNFSDLFSTTPLYIKKPNITLSKKDYFN